MGEIVEQMQGITLTPLKIIEGDAGKVMHALKANEESFSEFGEAYFSTVEQGKIKGWKKHTKMISNLLVVQGEVQFVFYDDREGSATKGKYFSIKLSPSVNYQRLTAEPGLWMAFKCIGEGENMLLNVSSIVHDPEEAMSKPLGESEIKFPE